MIKQLWQNHQSANRMLEAPKTSLWQRRQG